MDVGGDGKPPAVSFSAGPTRNAYSTYSSRDRSIEKQTHGPTLKQNRCGLIAGTLPRHLPGHPLLWEMQGGRESVVDWTGPTVTVAWLMILGAGRKIYYPLMAEGFFN